MVQKIKAIETSKPLNFMGIGTAVMSYKDFRENPHEAPQHDCVTSEPGDKTDRPGRNDGTPLKLTLFGQKLQPGRDSGF